jgi:hypothetical protein
MEEKNIGEKDYSMDTLDFIERLLMESKQLNERIDKLQQFTTTDTYTGLNSSLQQLMMSQLNAMKGYDFYLKKRIDLIKTLEEQRKANVAIVEEEVIEEVQPVVIEGGGIIND